MRWGGTAKRAAALAGLYWRDATFTLWSGPDGGADGEFTVELSGRFADVISAPAQLTLQMADPGVILARPTLSSTFAGTGGIEGIAELKGRFKRRAAGKNRNVELWSLDPANNIWVATDPAKPLQAFDQVYDRGNAASALTLVGWAGSTAATLAALAATSCPAGGAAIAPSIGCLKWWFAQPGKLTCDIRGEIGAGYADTAADIAAWLVAAVNGPVINAASLIAARALRPDVTGLLVSSDESAGVALTGLLSGVSLWWGMTSAGEMEFGPWTFGASGGNIVGATVKRLRTHQPVKRVTVGYRPNNFPMSRGDIAAVVFDAAYADGTPIDDLRPGEAGATSSDNLIRNGSLSQNAAGWVLQQVTAPAAAWSASPAGSPGSWPSSGAFFFPQNGVAYANANNAEIRPLNGAKSLWLSAATAKSAPTASGSPLYAIMAWFKDDGSASSTPTQTIQYMPTVGDVWAVKISEFVAPADASKWQFYFYGAPTGGAAYVTNVRVATTELGATYGATPAQVSALNAATSQANSAAIDAADAQLRIQNIVSDSILDKSEKRQEGAKYRALRDEQPNLSASAAELGITTERTTYNTKVADLLTYWTGLSPSADNVLVDTPINATTYALRFKEVADAKVVLTSKILAVTSANATGGDNQIVNGSLQYNMNHWSIIAGAPVWVAASVGSPFLGYIAVPSGGVTVRANDAVKKPLDGARLLHLDIDTYHLGGTGNIFALAAWYKADGTAASVPYEQVPVSLNNGVLNHYHKTFTAPADAASYFFQIDSTIVGSTGNSAFTNVRLAKTEMGADVTAAAQLVIEGVESITINYNYDNTPQTSLPKTQAFVVKRGGVDVTSTSALTATIKSGTISATIAAGALSLNTSGGALTSAVVEIGGTDVNGAILPAKTVRVTRVNADAPVSGGGGSGSSGSSSSTFSNTTNTTTHKQVSPDLNIVIGSAGTATLSATYSFDTASTSGNFEEYTQWGKWNGSIYVLVGTETLSTIAYRPAIGDPGSGACNRTETGMIAASTQRFALFARNSSGTVTRNIYGDISAVAG